MISMAQPLVTFAILTYKQEDLVGEAMRAALAQTYTPLQILVSDDSSGDRTLEIAKEATRGYSGPHELTFVSTPRNLNICDHIHWMMQHAKGDLVVYAPGDDVSYPERTQRNVDVWLAGNRSAHSVYSRMEYYTLAGKVLGAPKYPVEPEDLAKAVEQGVQVSGCTNAWTHDIFDVFGPMLPGSAYEDMIMPFRARLLGGVAFIDEVLVKYRIDNAGLSRPDLQDEDEAFKTLLGHLKNLVNVFDNHSADVRTLEQLGGRVPDKVKQAIDRMRDIFDDKHAFLSTSGPGRLKYVAKYAAKDPLRAVKWSAIALAPGAYKRRNLAFWQRRRSL